MKLSANKTQKNNKGSNSLQYFFALSLVFVIFTYFAYQTRDPDFGWHLKAGEYILNFGVPKSDIFSFAASSFAWINHEWANDCLVFLLYSTGGKALLASFFAAIWSVAIFLASRRKSAFVALLAATAVLPFSGIRPVSWTVLFVALLERLHDSKNKRSLYVLPIIMLLWANLHGGFAFGLLLMTIWQIRKKTRINWLIYVSSILTVFINPYFWRIFIEIGSTMFDSQLKFRIAEWMPLRLPKISLLYIVAYFVAFFVVQQKPIKKLISIPGLTFAMALSSIRHLPLFVVTSMRYLEENIDQLKLKIENQHIKHKFVITGFIGLLLFMLAAGFLASEAIRASSYSESYFPQKAVAYIQNNPCKKNIFNEYNYGGYLIEKLPSYKFYIDGRMPSWQEGSQSYFENYEKFSKDSTYRNSEISKFEINCAIIQKKSSLVQELKLSGWYVIEEASAQNYVLLKKSQN